MKTEQQDTVVGVLRKVRSLLEQPEKWVKGATAVTSDYISVAPSHAEAAKWCLLAGVSRSVPKASELYLPVVRALAMELGDGYDITPDTDNYTCRDVLAAVNDAPRTEHGDVLALIDRAIQTHEQ